MIEHHATPGHLARRFQQRAVAAFHAQLEAVGSDITSVQYAALMTVGRNPGIDQASLASDIAIDRATITGVVDRLVAKGLLTRSISKRDRRARELEITEQGSLILTQIEPAVLQAQEIIVSKLDFRETTLLIQLLQKATGTRE